MQKEVSLGMPTIGIQFINAFLLEKNNLFNCMNILY
jgi:hypothetical protein